MNGKDKELTYVKKSSYMNQQSLDTSTATKTLRYLLPQQDGILVIDKPGGITSASCIAKVKRIFGQKKIGHAGTLDPMATGVLLVLLGQATKISGYLMEIGEKIYSGHIRLGVTTDTWDVEGRVLTEQDARGITEASVKTAFTGLVGTYEQEVPAYSAAKHNGKPLYELARKGLATPVKKKERTIFWVESEMVSEALIHFRVKCSSGTYIRSLAHSLGIRLGCGATLETLTREHSAPFGLEHSCSLEKLQEEPEAFPLYVHSIVDALPGWHRVVLSEKEAASVKNGMSVPCFDKPEEQVYSFQEQRHAILETKDGIPLALASSTLLSGKKVWKIERGLWNQ